MMKLRFFQWIAMIALFLILGVSFTPATLAADTTQTFFLTEKASLAVENTNEEKTLVIPELPLTFESKIEWRIDFDKKITFTTKTKPYAKIFLIFPNGQSKEQTTIFTARISPAS
jgi:hypothetical protein